MSILPGLNVTVPEKMKKEGEVLPQKKEVKKDIKAA
jgi:hypothetical protein